MHSGRGWVRGRWLYLSVLRRLIISSIESLLKIDGMRHVEVNLLLTEVAEALTPVSCTTLTYVSWTFAFSQSPLVYFHRVCGFCIHCLIEELADH